MIEATGRELAEKGIQESHDHAEEVDPQWTERAIEQVQLYAESHDEFLIEDVRAWAKGRGFIDVTNGSAWGFVARAAEKRLLIHKVGTREAKSPGQHGKRMSLWKNGPPPIGQELVTADDARNMADELERWAEQMRREGRVSFHHGLLKAARIMRGLL